MPLMETEFDQVIWLKMKLWNAAAESRLRAHILFSHSRRKVLTRLELLQRNKPQPGSYKSFRRQSALFLKNSLNTYSHVLAAENSTNSVAKITIF